MRRSLLSLLALLLPLSVLAQSAPSAATLLKGFQFREMGPSVTGGRIIDIEVHPSQPNTIYVGAATGGVWKSTNNGVSWTCIYQYEKTISMGDMAIAPSNPNIIWLGTGENNSQRSAHYGDGVWKSTDAGKTWTNMGLADSMRVGRVAIDPKNPDIVYVAAMGYLYKPGGGKGLFKTTDGGKTWNRILQGENDTCAMIDVVIDPKNPNLLFACSMDRLRRPWNIRDSGPGSAIYKSTDAGKNWTKISGANGLPGGNLGRIGMAFYEKDPKIVYSVIDNNNPGKSVEVYRSDDSGKTWNLASTQRLGGGSYYGKIFVDPNTADTVYVIDVQLRKSTDGGKTYRTMERGKHVDNHAIWIDPRDSEHVLCGNDGGFYSSYDGGENWHFHDNLPLAQFYAIGADMAVPYNVMGGLQDNGAWRAPSRSRRPSGINNSDWFNIVGGDGFYSVPDPEDPNTIYVSSQFGGITRFDAVTRNGRSIRPREQGLRFNWMTPFLTSPHSSKTILVGAQKVFKSLNRGDGWTAISPDLTTNNPDKIRGNVPHCTITTLDESPKKAGVIWAGTDDGNVWVTQDDGANWTQVNANMPGAPKEWWISRVHASPHDVATAFVTITGFREDEFTPLIYKTTDYGKTWNSIASNLPNEQLCVVKQDILNPDLLFVGTEQSCQVSLDGGKSWNKLGNGLPSAPVQDLLVHPRDGDLVVGTHGRGIFVMDVNPLRQLSADVMGKPFHLFKPAAALAFVNESNMFDAFQGSSRYTSPNPPFGAQIYFFLAADAKEVKIEILSVDGKVISEPRVPSSALTAGLNSVTWNLRGSGGMAQAGSYAVRITVDGQTQTQVLDVKDWIRA
ncbi:MAG: T9SS type A sorting domain-containing protein [Fimbriimonadaceae bacterium]|nr:T9SS type A sorting domain-containing protein [Fimbriimonadaceae bacterium]